MRKTVLAIVWLLLVVPYCMAQELSITFELAPNDTDAINPPCLEKENSSDTCALIKVKTKRTDLTFDVGFLGIEKSKPKEGEIWLYVPADVFRVKKISAGKRALIKDYDLGQNVQGGKTYVMVLTKPVDSSRQSGNEIPPLPVDSSRHPSWYFEGKFQAETYKASGITLGKFFGKINVEATFLFICGFDKSDTVYWNSSKFDERSYSFTYKPVFVGCKFGYGIIGNSRFRLTPQVGLGYTWWMADSVGEYTTDSGKTSSAACLSGSFGVRIEWMPIAKFGISLSPEYSSAFCKIKDYEELSKISSKIKNFGEGLNVRLGVFCGF